MWNKKNSKNELTFSQTETRLIDLENKLTVTKGESLGSRIKYELVINIYRLLYIK